MSTVPPVSICLTTYNRAQALAITLDSLLGQTFGDFEIIISDDCSTDHTEEVCRKYAVSDSRIKYYRNLHNLKMPGNLNAAISRSSGTYVANVHDGDVYRSDLIEKWKTALDSSPSAAFVFNDYMYVSNDGKCSIHRMPFAPFANGQEIALHYFRTFTSCVWGTVMVRRSAYEKTVPFNSRYGFISDVDMWLRLGRDNDVAYIPEPLITITPREPDHTYARIHWRHEFWTLGIYVDHLNYYRAKLPQEVSLYKRKYYCNRRKLLMRDMAICIKHGWWDRVRDGFAIWRDADDFVLKLLGYFFGNSKNIPEWYTTAYWDMANLSG